MTRTKATDDKPPVGPLGFVRNAMAHARRRLNEALDEPGRELDDMNEQYFEDRLGILSEILVVLTRNGERLADVWHVLDEIDAVRPVRALAAQLKYENENAVANWEGRWRRARSEVAERLWAFSPPPTAEDYAGYLVAIDIDVLHGADAARTFLREHAPRYLARACGACGVSPGDECKDGDDPEDRLRTYPRARLAVPHETRVLP